MPPDARLQRRFRLGNGICVVYVNNRAFGWQNKLIFSIPGRLFRVPSLARLDYRAGKPYHTFEHFVDLWNSFIQQGCLPSFPAGPQTIGIHTLCITVSMGCNTAGITKNFRTVLDSTLNLQAIPYQMP